MGDFVLNRTKWLALDDEWIQRNKDAMLHIHCWEKEEQPVFVKQFEWEGIGPYAFNRVALDPHDGVYKMWYFTYTPETVTYPLGYAESTDGLHWQRQDQPLATDLGAVVIDPRPDSVYRYLVEGYRRPEAGLPGRAALLRSTEGTRWEAFAGAPWWQGPSDVLDLLWDPGRECFVSYHKLWRVTGTTVSGERVCAYFADPIPHDGEKREIVHITGDELLFPEIRPALYELVNRRQGKDDGGGGIVTEDVAMLRVIGRAESRDFLHWTNHEVVLEPLADDALDVQYYGMPVVAYEGLYLAFPRYFEGISGRMDMRFAYSRDGREFRMPDAKPVLACGAPVSWDGGMVLATADLLEIDGKLCMYYGAMDVDHAQPEAQATAATGRAWLRKDGFASLSGGIVLTKPLRFGGRKLFINAEGQIAVRLLDERGKVSGTAEWSGDATGAAVLWRHPAGGAEDGGVPAPSGEPAQLEFDLTNGKLYAFWAE